MTMAATPASTLAQILREITETQGSPRQRWIKVLDAEFGTPEFTLRHAAVVEAFHYTAGAIAAEPPGRARDGRYAQLPAWWSAVVGPGVLWDSADHSMSLDDQSLRMLDATAERLEDLQNDGRPAEPDQSVLVELMTQAQGWIKEIAAEQSLNRGLKTTLTQHLENLIWAIENAERFGAGLILPAADLASGSMVRAATSTPGLWKRWGTKVAAFVGAVVLFSTGFNQTVDAIEHTRDIVGIVGELTPGDAGTDGADDTKPDPRSAEN